MLKKLPQNLILPLILKDVYNLSYKFIAEYLDVPVPVVGNRIYRSRKLFFKLLAEERLSTDLYTNSDFVTKSILPIQKLRYTALLLDDELTQIEGSALKENSKVDPNLRDEFEIQELVKLLLSNAISKRNAPISLKRKIEKEVKKRFLAKI